MATRRQTLAGMAAAGLTLGRPMIGAAQAKVSPITVVINQSPWFDSFRIRHPGRSRTARENVA